MAVVGGLFAGMLSCNKDLGNYDYTTITTVDSINGIDSEISTSSGSRLQISPKLVLGKNKNPDDFHYTWYYRKGGSKVQEGTWEVLQGDDKLNLDVIVEGPIGATNEKGYNMAFEMKNKTSGVVFRKMFVLKVKSEFANGYAVLCDNEGSYDIDMLALDAKRQFNVYHDILSVSGSEVRREGVVPRDIFCFVDPLAPDPFEKSGGLSLVIATDQYATRLNKSDYSWKPNYDISNIVERNSYLYNNYVKQEKPIVPEKLAYSHFNGSLSKGARLFMLHKEGTESNWYFYTNDNMPVFFSAKMNSNRDKNDHTNAGKVRFEPAPFVANMQFGTMFYDTATNKFMYASFDPIKSHLSADTWYSENIPTEQTPFLNKSENAGLLWMETRNNNGSSILGYAIVKQTDGSYRYLEFGCSRNLADWTSTNLHRRSSVISAEAAATSGLATAKFVARPDYEASPTNFLYFVNANNQIYKVDLATATAVVYEITMDIIPAADKYKEVTMFRYTLSARDMPNDASEAKYALMIGTYNPELGKTEGGKLRMFTVRDTSTGTPSLAKYPNSPTPDGYQTDMEWTGLGRIVGVAYKKD
jgi:hypothetical protein